MPARFDVFLSHTSTDKPLVEELARRLARENIKPWLDKWNLIPGTAWQPETAQRLTGLPVALVHAHVKPLVDRVFPLEEAADAHRHLESGKQFGKVVLTV